jgi:hypothetical protein
VTDALTTILADDPDAYVDREITDAAGADLTFTANVAIGTAAYTTAGTWQGDVGPKRVLRVPVAGLAVGTHRMYLQIPGGNDLDLGRVRVVARTDR